MTTPSNDPSIEHEPHLSGRLTSATNRSGGDDEQVEHSVWDEPGLSPALAGETPVGALTYARWFTERSAATGGARSWATTLAVALAAGPWAIIGALLGGGQTAASVLMITIFGPLLEEVMKTAAPLWVVEKRPFLFRSRFQIALCVAAGAIVFAVVENLLYLNVYFPDASTELIRWRWTVCVGLHVGCSLISGLGLMRIWSRTFEHKSRPELTIGSPYLCTAAVIHAAYNTATVLMSMTDFRF